MFDRCVEGIDHLKSLFFERMKNNELKPNFYYNEETIQFFYRDTWADLGAYKTEVTYILGL
ncbi:unnamed protein product [Mucor hiemalis]